MFKQDIHNINYYGTEYQLTNKDMGILVALLQGQSKVFEVTNATNLFNLFNLNLINLDKTLTRQGLFLAKYIQDIYPLGKSNVIQSIVPAYHENFKYKYQRTLAKILEAKSNYDYDSFIKTITEYKTKYENLLNDLDNELSKFTNGKERDSKESNSPVLKQVKETLESFKEYEDKVSDSMRFYNSMPKKLKPFIWGFQDSLTKEPFNNTYSGAEKTLKAIIYGINYLLKGMQTNNFPKQKNESLQESDNQLVTELTNYKDQLEQLHDELLTQYVKSETELIQDKTKVKQFKDLKESISKYISTNKDVMSVTNSSKFYTKLLITRINNIESTDTYDVLFDIKALANLITNVLKGLSKNEAMAVTSKPRMSDMIQVDSSAIDAIGFTLYNDDSGNGDLDIELKQGKVYRYSDVPKGVFTALRMANSVGQYYTKNIKGQYKSIRIE